MPTIKPTISRKVWFYAGGNDYRAMECLGDFQPFDATIVYVHTDNRVNLAIRDHVGRQHVRESVELRDPGEQSVQDCHAHPTDSYATWMPYQIGQAKAT